MALPKKLAQGWFNVHNFKTTKNERKPLTPTQPLVFVATDDVRRKKCVAAAFVELGDAAKVGLAEAALTRRLKMTKYNSMTHIFQ